MTDKTTDALTEDIKRAESYADDARTKLVAATSEGQKRIYDRFREVSKELKPLAIAVGWSSDKVGQAFATMWSNA